MHCLAYRETAIDDLTYLRQLNDTKDLNIVQHWLSEAPKVVDTPILNLGIIRSFR